MAGLPMCQLLGGFTVSHSHLPQNLNKHSHPIFLDSSIGISQLSKYDCREERERGGGGGGGRDGRKGGGREGKERQRKQEHK